jgi:methylenetetrahydrofolate dehydrogenase (NADP+)/methenyltetrahydrofolate cyclohydrolase
VAKLLEGKPIAEKIKEKLNAQVSSFGSRPVLASIIVGDNHGAFSYVKSQARVSEEIGVEYKLVQLDKGITQAQLADFIIKLNSDKSVNGIIVQMPLPGHIDCRKISETVDPLKDVEGMHPENAGKLFLSGSGFASCTAIAVMELLGSTGLDLYGKEAVVVGHSDIAGKPLALLLLEKLATVTVCHIATTSAGRLEEHVRRAQVLIVAVGKAGLIKGEWIREGAVVIDVGINRVGGKISGDVEFEKAAERASYITPVPGGVGPLTVVMLMRNLMEAARLQQAG